MRRSSLLTKAVLGLALAAAVGACSPGPASLPPAPAVRATFDTLFASRQLTGFAIAPSGASVLYSLTGIEGNRLLERPLDGGAEQELPLATSRWPWRLLSLSPRGRDGVLLVGGAPGDGCRAPLAVRREDGRLLRVDPGDGGCSSFLGWTREGAGLLLASEEATPGAPAAVEVALATGLRSLRFASDEGWRLGPLTPDGRRLYLSRPGPDPPAALAVADLASGEIAPLPLPGREGDPPRVAPQATSADGRQLFVLIEDGERRGLARLDLAQGRWEELPGPCPAPERLHPSPGGQFLGVDCASGTHVLLAPAPEEGSEWRSAEVPLPAGVALWGVSWSGDDGFAVAAAGSGSWPLDLFAWERGAAVALQLTYHLGPRVDPADLGPSRPLPSLAGRSASLFAGRPGSPPAGGVIWIDDPWPGQGRAAPPFHPLAHWLAGQGIPVLRVSASASPFGDPSVPPDPEVLARELAAAAGGARPTGLVGVGRQAAWGALGAGGSWRARVAIAPGVPPAAEEAAPPAGARPAEPPDLLRFAPSLSGRSLLLGPGEGEPAFPEALRAALAAEGAAPGPDGAFGPDSPGALELWRAAARLLREGARP